MFRIIKMSIDLENCVFGQETLELMPETFETKKEAVDYICKVVYPKNSEEWADLYSDEDDVSTEIEDQDLEDGYNIINYFDGDECFIEKYQIVEV